MSIKYALTKDGAFVAGDTKTGMTSYAYPTSQNAREAKRLSKRWDAPTRLTMLAMEMVGAEQLSASRASFDAINWKRIGVEGAQPWSSAWAESDGDHASYVARSADNPDPFEIAALDAVACALEPEATS